MTERRILRIGGMHCVRCAAAVERALRQTAGVVSATVSYASGRGEVEFDPAQTSLSQLAKAVARAGYAVIEDAETFRRREWRTLRALVCLSAVLAAPFLLMMALMAVAPSAPLTRFLHENGWWQLALAAPVQFGIGWRFYKGAALSLWNRSPGMDVLVVTGTSAAFGYSLYHLLAGRPGLYFESSVVIITLVLLGKMLEMRAKTRTSAAIGKLMELAPATATVLRDGRPVEIPAADVRAGDCVRVRPGGRIPVDGTVTEGASFVDEAMLTGESMPAAKKPGDKVFGGTINRSGALTFRAEGVGEGTVLAGIIRLVEEAQSSKAEVQALADKVAAVFVPVVILIALGTLAVSLALALGTAEAVSRAVAVLVIACPCSLGLATPTALVVGIGRGAGKGILIKNARALERASRVRALILDKTGTLIVGRPEVTAVEAAGGDAEAAIRLAAAVEARSEHPLAEAIVRRGGGNLPEVEGFESVAGCGVRARVAGAAVAAGKRAWIAGQAEIPAWADRFAAARGRKGETVLFVSKGGELIAAVAVADPVRASAASAVARLRALGIRVVLATGDQPVPARAIAAEAGIGEVLAGLMPADKVAALERIRRESGEVAMVGDGINDAPALAAADVGFAVGSGTDIAREAGDIVLVGDCLAQLPEALRLSRATMRKIRQNLFWAFFYNSVGLPLAAAGFLSPVVAGAAMAFSSVSVVSNSLSLR